MQVVLALFALISVALAVKSELQYKNAFAAFMTQHGKVYADASEAATRYNIFKVNLDFVENFNGTFKVAMNKFGDMSNEEFRAQFNGLSVPEGYLHDSSMFVRSVGTEQLPSSMDWRTKGAVTAVKNQQQCGSCWSFSTTGSMEGCHFLATNKLVSLSEKNLMDCSWNQGNMACNGGLMTSAMQYIKSNNGIDTEASYPYVPVSSHDCRYKLANRGAQIGSFTNVPSGSESDLQSTVNRGPVSVAIDASHSSFQFYSHGVYYEPACSSSRLDHGVLAIGWGVESGSDYWLVKNSWGADWGMQGYIKMTRNRNNNCGIATMATLPTNCH